jgi:predicted O-methyltransferase YrrM
MHARVADIRYAVGSRRAERRCVKRLRGVAQGAATPEEIVETAFADGGPVSIRPTQVPSELRAFVALIREDAPSRLLEIGTAKGGTLYALACASAPTSRVLSLDVDQPSAARLRLYRHFAGRGRTIDVLVGDSRLEATRAQALDFFRHQPLDVLFIDGDHAYESVKRDYELYGPLVRSGGIVALHDIVDGRDDLVGGVPRLWRETSFVSHQELVESRAQGGYGIGVGRRP